MHSSFAQIYPYLIWCFLSFCSFSAHAQIDLYLHEVIREEPNYTSLEKQQEQQILTYEWTTNKVVQNPFVFSKKLYFVATSNMQWICFKWESFRPILELKDTLLELNTRYAKKEDYTWIDSDRAIAYTITIFTDQNAFQLTARAVDLN